MAQPRNRTAQHPPPFSPFRPAPLGPLAAQPHSSRTSPLPRGPAWHRDPQLPRPSAPSSHCALAPFVSAHPHSHAQVTDRSARPAHSTAGPARQTPARAALSLSHCAVGPASAAHPHEPSALPLPRWPTRQPAPLTFLFFHDALGAFPFSPPPMARPNTAIHRRHLSRKAGDRILPAPLLPFLLRHSRPSIKPSRAPFSPVPGRARAHSQPPPVNSLSRAQTPSPTPLGAPPRPDAAVGASPSRFRIRFARFSPHPHLPLSPAAIAVDDSLRRPPGRRNHLQAHHGELLVLPLPSISRIMHWNAVAPSVQARRPWHRRRVCLPRRPAAPIAPAPSDVARKI